MNLLNCAYCNASLKKTTRSFRDDWYVVTCNCTKYPVLSNIFFLVKDDHHRYKKIIDFMEEGKYAKALAVALSHESRIHRATMILIYYAHTILKLDIQFNTLLKFFSLVGPHKSWFRYLLKGKDRDILNVALNLLKKHKEHKVILDIGSGPAFLEYYSTADAKTYDFYCLDKSFFSLLMARLFTIKDRAVLVCCDIEHGIPFKKESADSVFILDTFAWIYNKQRFLDELVYRMKKNTPLYIINIYANLLHFKFIGDGIHPKNLKQMLKNNLKNSRFFKNHLKKNKIQYTPFSKINLYGYSCTAIKK